MLTSDRILSGIRDAVERLDHVNAMWLGGSVAMGAADEWSDIDVQLDVADDRVEETWSAVEAALAELSSISASWAVPEPTWHGHAQRVYQLADAPEHLMIDMVIMTRSTTAPRLDEREIHGEPVVIFDKLGVIRSTALDVEAHRDAIRRRMDTLRRHVALLSHFPAKEIERGLEVDAFWRYQMYVIRLLVDALRTRHKPVHYNFGPRYLKRDLPPDVYARLMRLAFVADLDDLARKLPEAVAWLKEETDAIDVDALVIE